MDGDETIVDDIVAEGSAGTVSGEESISDVVSTIKDNGSPVEEEEESPGENK